MLDRGPTDLRLVFEYLPSVLAGSAARKSSIETYTGDRHQSENNPFSGLMCPLPSGERLYNEHHHAING